MPFTDRDKDQILSLIKKEVDSKTNTVNQFKGTGTDRRDYDLVGEITVTQKNEDEGPLLDSSGNTIAT